MTKKTGCEILKILIKAVMPHRQKVLTQDGQEMRLQQWANKQAASSLRDAGGDAQGEQFSQSRDMLMRDAVENPEKYGLKFMGERLPFEGQNLQESLSDPMDSPEFKEDMTEDESFSLAEKLDEKDRTPNLFDSEGKLRQTMPTEEEEEKMRQETGEPSFASKEEAMAATFDPDAEAEHMRRIMTSRQVPMRDAWSILKGMPQCKVCQGKLEEVHPGGGEMVCMNANCPAQMMIQSEGQPPRLRFPIEGAKNARNNPDYSQDLGY